MADRIGVGDFIGKTRKLSSLTVDKGLLREVREVQKIVGALIQCRVSFRVLLVPSHRHAG